MAISNREIDLMATVIELQKEVNGLKDLQSSWKKENKELRTNLFALENQLLQKDELLKQERASYSRLRDYVTECGLDFQDPIPF